MSVPGVYLFTRPGFEAEAGREWVERAGAIGVHGVPEPFAGRGLVRVGIQGENFPRRIREEMPVGSLVFTRDAFFGLRRVDALPPDDRVGAVVAALDGIPADRRWGELSIHVRGAAARGDLSNFARKWMSPLSRALRERAWLKTERDSAAPRLELILLDFERLIIAQSFPGHRSGFPGGRPRLRPPARAPSRAVLKIEEAFLTMLSDKERRRLLKPGMDAVDLGASPGGWTYYLISRGLTVTAVDNGPMSETVMRGGRVEHLRADGFAWLPDAMRDWMVCDIADKPERTVELVGRWFQGGHCRASVFNLKLPMKKRLDEWWRCRRRLEDTLAATGRSFELRARQLYHDREEVTVMVLPAGH